MFHREMIVPTKSNLHRVTSVKYGKAGRVETVQVTALYDECIKGRHTQVIVKRSTTFHFQRNADGAFDRRNKAGAHVTFKPADFPGLGAAVTDRMVA